MDPQHLTSVLRSKGHDVTVESVKLTPMETNGIGSEFLMAELRYSSDGHSLPDRMAVKRPLTGDRGRCEADLYEWVLGSGTGLATLGYYGVVDEGPGEPLSLLFEDLSDSHHQTPWPIVPGLADCRLAVRALAGVHAHWWGRTEATNGLTPQVAAHQNADHLARVFPAFADRVGEYLSPVRTDHYERMFAGLDALLAVRATPDHTTLLHTDPHFWNFLYPDDPGRDRCVIFDWPLWRTGLAGSDLAYMIGLHLYPEHRRRFEPVLLDAYRQALADRGITQDRQDVQLDYRIGLVVGLLMPVMEFSWQIPPADWMPKLEKAFAAYDDLNCRALLDAV